MTNVKRTIKRGKESKLSEKDLERLFEILDEAAEKEAEEMDKKSRGKKKRPT